MGRLASKRTLLYCSVIIEQREPKRSEIASPANSSVVLIIQNFSSGFPTVRDMKRTAEGPFNSRRQKIRNEVSIQRQGRGKHGLDRTRES